MCPYCKHLFDVKIGDKFKSGEIKSRWGEDENSAKIKILKQHRNKLSREISKLKKEIIDDGV